MVFIYVTKVCFVDYFYYKLCCAIKHFYRLCPYIIFLLFVSEQVAFHAHLSLDIHGTTAGQTIVFDQVDTNLGGGYSGTTGVFTAPVAGTYVFSLTFFMYYPSSSYVSVGELYIMQNNVQSIRVWLELGNNIRGTASGTAVLSLNKGDHVYVQVGTARMYIGGDRVSFFSGFLLG